MWAFMLGTGVRFGEATGLLWQHVDLDNATALICQQAVRARDLARPPKEKSGLHPMRRVISPVKTDAGRREVHLPGFVVDALRRQRDIVTTLQQGHAWRPEYPDLVFPTNVGTILDEGYIYKMWRAELARIGLGALRMHDLRHTKGTLMADEGEDTTTIQRALGHARQSITADLYIGRTSKAQRKAAERYDALIGPSLQPHDDEA
jgi:integrase